ncbi:MAG: class I SAM-dependent methyltransferase, partial [Candidatus Lokiarchaeota archaeon]|nr:class I SAM-dependent methyltransferase [Candidatus Lokiarchaeota archaeon]
MDYKDLLSGQTRENFWSMAKRELIDIALGQHARSSRPGAVPRILNIGAGVGDDLAAIKAHGTIHLVDIDAHALTLINDKDCAEKRVASITNLPYPDGFFDVVICLDVFEHVGDDARAFSEVHRVLRNHGRLIFTVPAFPWLYSSHDRVLKHVRRYSLDEIRERLVGFKIVFLSYWDFFLFLPISLWRMSRRHAPPREDVVPSSRAGNRFLFHVLHVENMLVQRGIHLPLG